MLLGFGITVGIWVFAGVYFSARIAGFDERSAAVSERFVHAQRMLTEARLHVVLSSVNLRDTLLDPAPASAEAARVSTMAALDAAAHSLSSYAPILESRDEQARVEHLLAEVIQLREVMLEMLATDSRQWQGMARQFLQGRLTPRRQAFLKVADELGDVNRAAFVAHQAEMVGLYRGAQRRIWQVLGLAVAVSLAVAGLSTVYAGRLERQVRAQHDSAIDMQHGLQRLSAELIRVRENERRVIARELHDEIGQLLTAAKYELAVAQNVVDEHGGPADVLDDARPIVERALQAVRDLSHILHPAVLDDLGLSAAVDLHIKEFRRRHAIAVELAESGMDARVPRAVESAAYRIVQEALTNIAKHAHATSCRVSLVRLARGVMVVVGDNGVGFDAGAMRGAQPDRGLGLVSMRERALQLGGSLVVESAPGQGTRVVAELPFAEAPDDAVSTAQASAGTVGLRPRGTT